jgi:hypothetical protein
MSAKPPLRIDDLRLWELGAARHPVDRGLLLLDALSPHAGGEELAELNVGERNRRLLSLAAEVLGPSVEGLTACPLCGEAVALGFDPRALERLGPRDASPDAQELESGGARVRFRPPNSRDLAAIASCADVAEARRTLIARCILSASVAGRSVEAVSLGEDVLALVSEALYERDPLAETRLRVTCPACAHTWSPVFDVVAFLWCEVARRARALLQEVHILARAYGWREEDILAMTPVRRQSYLAMVGS